MLPDKLFQFKELVELVLAPKFREKVLPLRKVFHLLGQEGLEVLGAVFAQLGLPGFVF